MTREEQIKNYAIINCIQDDIDDTSYELIVETAKWADETMLDKACKWLNSVDMRMYVIVDHTSSNINRFDINKFISNFRKAMEE